MDLFTFYPPSSVLICKPCGYAVPPTTLSRHIKVHHLEDARHAAANLFNAPKSRNPATLLANYLCERYQLLDPATARKMLDGTRHSDFHQIHDTSHLRTRRRSKRWCTLWRIDSFA
jgi:hypothetical protein